ncbi:hypothetical protein Tco_0532304 [Tanacetum coccineum]
MTTPITTSITDSQMHNNIMAAGSRDRPPITNGDALRKCNLEGLYKPTIVTIPAVPATDDTPAVSEQTSIETILTMSPENKAHYESEKEAIHLLLTRIGDESYSTIDACKTSHEMWISIERLQQVSSTTSTRMVKDVNEIHAERIAKNANPLALIATASPHPDLYYQAPKSHKPYTPTSKQSSSTRSNASTKFKGKKIAKPITPPSESASEEDKLSSNFRNKNVDTSPRYKNDNQTGQFGNQRTEFSHFAKECRKLKRVKHYTCHKEKMLLCKQAKKGVPLQEEQDDWIEDTDEEIDEQVQYNAEYNVFANMRQHSQQPESTSNTCLVEKDDSNVTPDSPDMCENDIQTNQNAEDECVALANLIANLKLNCKSILVETSRTLRESNSIQDSYLIALQNKQTEFERELVDQAWVKHSHDHFRALTALDMEVLIKTCLMPLFRKTQNDSFTFVHELKQEMHANLKYIESLENEIDELESDKAEFSNMYDILLQECVSNDVMCSYLHSLSDLDAHAELQCLYVHKVKECECLAQKLSKQTKTVSKEVHNELSGSFAKLEKHSIFLELALQQYLKAPLKDKNISISELKKLIEKIKGKSVDTNFEKQSILWKPPLQPIRNQLVVRQPTAYKFEQSQLPRHRITSQVGVSHDWTKPVTPHSWPQVRKLSFAKPYDVNAPGPSRKSL